MSTFLPMFPLKLVVFPREKIKLHIFEPRYRQLIGECRQDGTTFGLPAYLEGGVAQFGTEMTLINIFKEYEDGELDILAEGVRAFSLDSFVKVSPDKLYPGGEVTFVENDPSADPAIAGRLAEVFGRFHSLLKTDYARGSFDSPNVSFDIAQEVGLTLTQKVRLLSMSCETDRQHYLVEHLERVMPVLEGAEEARKRVRGNGHFKRLPPLDL
ncbi:MAG: peptidase [bacterium]|nr:peptidase [bacterium]